MATMGATAATGTGARGPALCRCCWAGRRSCVTNACPNPFFSRRRDDRDRREREDRERDWARVCGGGGGQPRRPSGGLPPRGPSNPLIAEAYRLAREKKQAEERERGRASDADSSPEPERPRERHGVAPLP